MGYLDVPSSGSTGGSVTLAPRVVHSVLTTGQANLNAYTTTSLSGSLVATPGSYVDLRRGTSPTGGVWLTYRHAPFLLPIYNKNPIFSTTFADGDQISGQNYSVYINMDYAGAASGSLPDANTKYIGFNLTSTGTLHKCYSVHRDGTNAEVRTDISSSMTFGNNPHVLTAVMTSAASIKFYVNGTLAATHTVNLPSGATSGSVFMGVAAQGSLGSADLSMGLISEMQVSHDV
jgi:hypothetical protein